MSKYILSTMTSSVSYCVYQNVGDVPMLKHKVLIRGGASIPSDKSGIGEMTRDSEGKPIWTADGVVTTISDSDYEAIKDNHVFKSHLANGLIKVINHDITGSQREISKLTQHMGQDGFRQLNPTTIKKMAKLKKVTQGSVNQDDDDFRL